jgi:hypothetical protein
MRLNENVTPELVLEGVYARISSVSRYGMDFFGGFPGEER